MYIFVIIILITIPPISLKKIIKVGGIESTIFRL